MNKPRIPTNLRLLMILEALGELQAPVSSADVGRALGLSKQTAHRLCATLVDEGFLVREDRSSGLRPGRRARMLAAGLMNASSAHVARRQVLATLAADVGETVNFVVPEDRGMTYQDRVETDWPFRVQLPIGTHVPFHCTASGKTYLASLPKAERTRMVHVMHLQQMTPNTITDPTALLEELARIARQGYALDREEFIEGMTAIAVPVRDPAGRYVASVAFHGPVQRIPLSLLESKVQTVLDTSARLTEVMFAPDS